MNKTSDIPVVILCGGRGTRLQEKTAFIPKPLIEIGSQPIIWHIMKIYQTHGFNEFYLSGGYKWKMFRSFIERYNNRITAKVIDTGLKTGKGGRIFRLRKLLKGRFMCTYGDGVSDINLEKLLKFHQKKGKIATITCVQPQNQYGIVNIKNQLVTSFVEKPKMKDWINAGFFVFEREIFNYLNENGELEGKPFENLAKDSQIAAYKHRGFWASMDTYKDYQYLNSLWKTGKAFWKTW